MMPPASSSTTSATRIRVSPTISGTTAEIATITRSDDKSDCIRGESTARPHPRESIAECRPRCQPPWLVSRCTSSRPSGGPGMSRPLPYRTGISTSSKRQVRASCCCRRRAMPTHLIALTDWCWWAVPMLIRGVMVRHLIRAPILPASQGMNPKPCSTAALASGGCRC